MRNNLSSLNADNMTENEIVCLVIMAKFELGPSCPGQTLAGLELGS